MTGAHRRLQPPPEPPRPAPLDTSQLIELEYRPLRHNLAATFYGHQPGPRRGRTKKETP